LEVLAYFKNNGNLYLQVPSKREKRESKTRGSFKSREVANTCVDQGDKIM
jgi:hypothetical protein